MPKGKMLTFVFGVSLYSDWDAAKIDRAVKQGLAKSLIERVFVRRPFAAIEKKELWE